MNANELANLLEVDSWYKLVTREEIATMLRQQQAEIEALKMGFANSGTHDSELAETRAMAGRLFLKVQDLEFEREGYENLTEMLESEKAELTEKNCQQQAEIEALKQIIDANNLNQNIGQFVKPTNEPVAELVLEQMAVGDASSLRAKWLTDSYPPVGTKLYTHPVKKLADEEIRHIQAQCHLKDVGYDGFIMRFAKAILRKAQEK